MAQVKKKHYFNNYDTLPRFISYYYQIKSAIDSGAKNILEIGPGNKTVYHSLKNSGVAIDTCDIDKTLGVDYVGDIRKLPVKDNSYDLIMACQVLEHIPWKDFPIALSELHRASRKKVMISLPYSSLAFELILRIPFLNKICDNSWVDFLLRIPLFLRKIKFDGEHYWEIGAKGYPLYKIRKEVKKYFKIKSEFSPTLNKYHHFFILEKK